jgi:hypothetical protein
LKTATVARQCEEWYMEAVTEVCEERDPTWVRVRNRISKRPHTDRKISAALRCGDKCREPIVCARRRNSTTFSPTTKAKKLVAWCGTPCLHAHTQTEMVPTQPRLPVVKFTRGDSGEWSGGSMLFGLGGGQAGPPPRSPPGTRFPKVPDAMQGMHESLTGG